MDYPVKTPEQLAQILRGVRRDRGMTQSMVAEQMGSLQSKVSAFEANPGKSSVARLFRLLSVVGLELVLRDRSTASKQQRKKPEW
jgi:HTH-type transcriptional regulator/antitoxin HipB